MATNKETKRIGRPKNVDPGDVELNEEETERLDMTKSQNKGSMSDIISIQSLDERWKNAAAKVSEAAGAGSPDYQSVAAKWNALNPFLQNQRLKMIYSQARSFDKNTIAEYLKDPGNHEEALRSAAWSSRSSQHIYYTILRRAADIPLYLHYVIPPTFDEESKYKSNDFKKEDAFLDSWLKTLDIQNTFKTIALEVKNEGKSSYLFRNKTIGEGSNRIPQFCTFQKLPTEWAKITGKGSLGYTVSFNMMYFMNIANNPANYGPFFKEAWEDLITTGVFYIDKKTNAYKFDADKGRNYSFEFGDNKYSATIEAAVGGEGTVGRKAQVTYMFWLKLPFDMCFTFGSDNSNPWVAPDTMGLLMNLQELSDYGQLAGLIASTPLSAVLTGEIEPISQQQRAGMNETVFSPEVVQGMMDRFNAATSTNIEAWMWPAKNIKLHQLEADVNASEILSTSTENFIQKAGESGLTITTNKPNIGQINVAKMLAASQQNYVTLQFQNVLNYIIKHKIGLKFDWSIKLWGDIFNFDADRKFLKECVAGGNLALFPKLMSAEGLSLKDTDSLTKYVDSLGIYKKFKTYTQEYVAQVSADAQKVQAAGSETEEKTGAGRPSLSEDEVENDATGASKDAGTNTSDNREHMSASDTCPICGGFKDVGTFVCAECAEKVFEDYGFGDEEITTSVAKGKGDK